MATQAEFNKLLQLGTLASQSAWADPTLGGSRSQETQARKAATQLNALGGQAELDRLKTLVLADPVFAQQYSKLQKAQGGLGQGFMDIAVPAAVFAGGVGLANAAGLLGAGTGAAGAGAGAGAAGAGMAGAGSAADVIAAVGGAGGGVTGAMETAGMLSAATAPGVAAGTAAANVATGLGYGSLGTAATGLGITGASTIPQILQQVAGTPGVSQVAQQVMSQGGGTPNPTPQTGGSWLDYLTTGLGLTQGIMQLTGGTSLDANAIRNMVDPFAPYRSQYAQQLNQLMAQPSSVTSLPGYQFLQDQGQQAVMRQLASQGRTVSGQEQLALQQQGQGLANQFYKEQYQKLAQLSGANVSPQAGGTAGANVIAANQGQQQAGLSNLTQLASMATTPNNPVSNTAQAVSNLWR